MLVDNDNRHNGDHDDQDHDGHNDDEHNRLGDQWL